MDIKVLDLMTIEFMFYILLAINSTKLFIKTLSWVIILMSILWILANILLMGSYDDELASHSVFLFWFIITNSIGLYRHETDLRLYINHKHLAKKEIEKTETLVKRLLPPRVYQNIKEGRHTTDTYEDTTIIYADIVGFTQWSANNTPNIIIGVLSELFAKFDELC